jgi:hypothetical protein
MFIVFLGV